MNKASAQVVKKELRFSVIDQRALGRTGLQMGMEMLWRSQRDLKKGSYYRKSPWERVWHMSFITQKAVTLCFIAVALAEEGNKIDLYDKNYNFTNNINVKKKGKKKKI